MQNCNAPRVGRKIRASGAVEEMLLDVEEATTSKAQGYGLM